jgi:hypothetical protein
MPRNYATSPEHVRQGHRDRRNKRYYVDPAGAQAAEKLRRHERLAARPFIGWDGEGWTDAEGVHHYMLFGNSNLECITGESLGTKECLDLILYAESQVPDAFHVGFAFEYDVQMILRDLPWRMLAVLYWTGSVIWNKYRIKHTPHKSFSVSKDGVSATIFDVFGFFHTSYMVALRKYKIGTAEKLDTIAAGKAKRGFFTWSQIEYVKAYWADEISLLPELMDEMRIAVYSAGMYVTEWHGPGALAAYALRLHHVNKLKGNEDNIPADVKIARRNAYAGGRFQSWRAGLHMGRIYTADVNSAYIYACSLLPNLANGHWERIRADSILDGSHVARFGLYRIAYDSGTDKEAKSRHYGIPFPLFHRGPSGQLTWPHRTEGWYWSPEAKLVIGDPDAKVLEAWVYHDDGERPFAWVWNAFQDRLNMQKVGDPAEKALKWMLASIYGQFARRVGWDKKRNRAPRSHQLEWAGFITSWCRAMVYTAAIDVAKRGGLISIDTDGVTSSVPFNPEFLPNGTGDQLGQWKLEEFAGILHWQNGIYWLRTHEGKWLDPKSRGIPRGNLSIARAACSLRAYITHPERAHNPSIDLERQKFTGYRQAIHGSTDNWRKWTTEPVSVAFGGNGKGMHIRLMCRKCQGEKVSMHTIVNLPPFQVMSEPHKLPWLNPPTMPDFPFGDDNSEELIFPDHLQGEFA